MNAYVSDPAIAVPVAKLDESATYLGVDETCPLMDEDLEVAHCLDWRKQLTVRGFLVGISIGFCMSIVSLKLSLTTGVIPSLNIAAGMLGFVGMRTYVAAVARCCASALEFSKQENTVIQTFAVAFSGVAFITGFGSYYIAMDENSWIATGSIESQKSEIVNPSYGNVIPYAFCTCFTGIFILVVMRERFIIDLKLPYPSGTATATMINSFFTDEGQQLAKQQFRAFSKWFTIMFSWDIFRWCFDGGPNDSGCGFGGFPTFGMKALDLTWNFDFSFNYIAVGMLCPHIVNYSMMFGSVISWGIMWPIIQGKAGDWYPEAEAGTLKGLLGYKVFFAIALIIGDGIYNIIKMGVVASRQYAAQARARKEDTQVENEGSDEELLSEADKREHRLRLRVFRGAQFPWYITLIGYLAFTVLGCVVVPILFPGTVWYTVLVAYLLCPLFAIPNAYMCGLTDWDMSSTFGKLVIFLFAVWTNSIDANTGIIAGLATCGIVFAGTSQAATLMQDFKTGYITRSSPMAMFIAQVVGSAAGCCLAPVAFFIFYDAFDVGNPNGPYPAPYGKIYRSMAIIGTEGFDALPDHCLTFCAILFFASFVLSAARDFSGMVFGEKVGKWAEMLIPIPMCMAIPFYIGAFLAISMCLGSLVKLVWEKKNKEEFESFYIAVASGVIAGDGIFAVPSAILSMAGVSPPICMSFAKST
eukprot:CAMPEP_0203749064 /NCGR_PEP_ID=MMETSP0098-20131031/3755_1 /ASSEMBLY_ACC=CAM_ASM_000208 /TAXON_ID=96639 /ORGANISM=" , Strain NY0313808BC1" /LENGTH=697 /DNA_ID=CAMNT_0050638007 /DNA_START=36 /DNA_END=2129 /DNA_ORIENTATION=-